MKRVLPILLLLGCTPATLRGITWPEPVTNVTIVAPMRAPVSNGDCMQAYAVRPGSAIPCVGVVVPPTELQYLMDVEVQRKRIIELVTAMTAARIADRSFADSVAATLVAERNNARRDRLIAAIVGIAIGIAGGGVAIGVGATR